MRWYLSLCLLLAAVPVSARPPAYPHKAGVSIEQLGEQDSACWNDGMKSMNDPAYRAPWMPPPPSNFPGASAAGSAIGQGIAKGIEDGKRFKLTYYDCLVANGFTLRRPTDADWKAAKKLKKPERQALLQQWMVAPAPLHPEAPREEFD